MFSDIPLNQSIDVAVENRSFLDDLPIYLLLPMFTYRIKNCDFP